MRHCTWRVAAVVCAFAGGLWSCADEHNCGAPGTHSIVAASGNCECEPGYVWASATEADYTCVSASGYVPQCTPACGGRACGGDGCGGFCGTCPTDTFCNTEGQCETGSCTQDCGSRVCGPDPVCGQSCGDCDSSETCTNAGQCVPTCTPDCAGKQCGDDGCGGSCGTCAYGTFCNDADQCETGACEPECGGRVCGPDPVCGQSCGDCPIGESCTGGHCIGSSVGSPVGGPCAADADCAGANATCLTDGFPDGYCIIMGCHEVGCDDGSTCFYLNQEQTESACFVTCETDDECRVGYECDSYDTCWPPVDLPEGNVGAPCTGDTDCTGAATTCLTEADEGMPGGYCSQMECSNGTCSEGSECFSFSDGSSLCLQTCVSHDDCRDGYACFDPGACWPGTPPCTPDDCEAGTFCASNGNCVPNPPTTMPAGPVPDCADTISWECAAGTEAVCGEVVAFEPNTGAGWWDYPINGETETNEYRSYCRRDLMQLVKYAAAQTECLTANWTYGNGGPIGLGDMSEVDGSIPGTAVGSPGHPPGTHTDGHDMDLAYFQVGTADNKLRSICDHYLDNQEQYHCVAPPDLLDEWRTAVMLAKLHDSPQLRVIGVDGQAGEILENRIAQLCYAGWLDGTACTSPRIAYSIDDPNNSWYAFHHHHFHVSIVDRPAVGWMSGLPPPGWYSSCLTPDCSEPGLDAYLNLHLNAPRLIER